jgi:hypothetical protein
LDSKEIEEKVEKLLKFLSFLKEVTSTILSLLSGNCVAGESALVTSARV